MRISPPAPRPLAQLRSWVTRCGATCPDSAVGPPPPPAQAPEPGHLRALGPCSSSSLQGWRSSQPCASASKPGFQAPSWGEEGRTDRARGPAPTAVLPPPTSAHRPYDWHLQGSTPALRARFPRGSMALPDPPGPPPRRTAPPRKWTPAAGLCQPGPPPARGTERGQSGRRSARPSARGQGR